jgi:hypothetical protein
LKFYSRNLFIAKQGNFCKMETSLNDSANEKPIHQIDKPLADHSRKLVRFAELLATGLLNTSECARRAGFAHSTAKSRSHEWIGDSRQTSEYPVLYDYYEKLRRKNLRELEVTQANIAKELALIGFSDLTRFIDLPSREYEEKARLAIQTTDAIYRIRTYPEDIKQFEIDHAQWVKESAEFDAGRSRKRKRPAEPQRPTDPTDKQRKLALDFSLLTDEAQEEFLFWRHYRAGSIRLKNREEIPAALLPAIAEVAETKDGIRLKLHDKIAALDRLARWQKMYTAQVEGDDDGNVVTEINITVNGAKSKLLSSTDAAAA